MIGKLVTLATGHARPITKSWPDGAYDCPWCGGVVQTTDPAHEIRQCANPACLAFPGRSAEWTTAELVRREEAEARRVASQVRRDALRKATKQYNAEKRARWDQLRAQAVERGCCLECLRHSGWAWGKPRFVRHRTPNFHTRG